MNYDISVVYKYPFGVFAAFHADGPDVMLPQFLLDIFGDRLDLGSACPRTDYKIICNNREVFEFEYDSIL